MAHITEIHVEFETYDFLSKMGFSQVPCISPLAQFSVLGLKGPFTITFDPSKTRIRNIPELCEFCESMGIERGRDIERLDFKNKLHNIFFADKKTKNQPRLEDIKF